MGFFFPLFPAALLIATDPTDGAIILVFGVVGQFNQKPWLDPFNDGGQKRFRAEISPVLRFDCCPLQKLPHLPSILKEGPTMT